MKKIICFLFSLFCIFAGSIVFAANEVVIKSVTPVVDGDSSIVVNEDNSVVFNDMDQTVEYKVVLENTTDIDLPIESITLSKPSEDFLIYELEGLSKYDVLKAKGTHEVIVSLSTIKKDGWGRNFNDELTAAINIDSSVLNPNTSDFAATLFVLFIVLGSIVLVLRNKRVAKYSTLLIAFFSMISYINAEREYMVLIKINASYVSQNVMSISGSGEEVCDYFDENREIIKECWNEFKPLLFWEYNWGIKNIYIENELSEPQEYAHKFDVSENKNEKVVAYLVEKKGDICYDLDRNENNCYDLYLQAEGIIYPNINASYYFAGMDVLETINNLDGLDTSKVTDMSWMFSQTGYSSDSLTLDLSSFYTSNVTDMNGMFYEFCHDCEGSIVLEVSNFDTSNVINMKEMFAYTAYYNENFVLDVSNFDTSNVTNMKKMFAYTGYNSTKFKTSITIKNPYITDYNDVFDNVASKTGAKITVNYTSETETLVDQMIATKSADSNVVKGVQVG